MARTEPGADPNGHADARPRARSLLVHWSGQVASGLADHAILAVSALALQIALARQLPAAEYGRFAIALAAMQVLLSAHVGLVIEPASVLGPSRHAANLAGYVRALSRLNLALAVGVSAVAGLAAVVLSEQGKPFASSLTGLAVCAPTQFVLAFARRTCYLMLRPKAALIGSTTYAATLGAAIAAMASAEATSSVGAFWAMALGGLSGTVASSLAMGLPKSSARLDLGPLWRENWGYGKWAFASYLAHWAGSGSYLFLVGGTASLAAAGTFRAVQNLVSPIQQALAAISVLLLPQLAAVSDPAAFRRFWRRTWYLTLALSSIYAASLVLGKAVFLRVLYPNDKYSDAASIVPAFAVLVVVTGATNAVSLALRAMNRPAVVFGAKTAGAAVALTAGLLLTKQFGLKGAAWGLVATVLTESLVLAAAWRRRANQEKRDPE